MMTFIKDKLQIVLILMAVVAVGWGSYKMISMHLALMRAETQVISLQSEKQLLQRDLQVANANISNLSNSISFQNTMINQLGIDLQLVGDMMLDLNLSMSGKLSDMMKGLDDQINQDTSAMTCEQAMDYLRSKS